MIEIRSFADQLERIEHYKALGMTRVSIPREADDLPWEQVTSLRPGGTHRLDMDTTINLEFDHPSGVTFFWWLEIEEHGSSGSGSYRIDTAHIGAIVARLPDALRGGALRVLDGVRREGRGAGRGIHGGRSPAVRGRVNASGACSRSRRWMT